MGIQGEIGTDAVGKFNGNSNSAVLSEIQLYIF